MTTRTLRAAAACALLTTTCLVSPALAQRPGSVPAPPVRQAVDGNGVDVIRGTFSAAQTSVSIGPADSGGLSYTSINLDAGWFSAVRASISQDGPNMLVTLDGGSDRFAQSGSSFTSTEGNGATLVQTGGTFTYTDRNGNVATFQLNSASSPYYDTDLARATSVVLADGTRTDYTYKTTRFCLGGVEAGSCPSGYYNALRLQSITNNHGYQLKLSYASNTLNELYSSSTYDEWSRLTSVQAINNVVEACNPAADSCALSGSWPAAAFSRVDTGGGTQLTITDPAGQATRYSSDYQFRLTGIKRPGASADTVILAYGPNGISSITREDVTYSYAYSDAGTVRTTTITAPDGGQQVYVSDTGTSLVSSYRDAMGRTTRYEYDANGRLTRVTAPENNAVQYSYDARGNPIETRTIAKAGTGLADIVTTASFDASCANAKTCNKPNAVADAAGNVADYSYDPAHGGLVSVTAPAPTPGAVRPETRLSYTPTAGVGTGSVYLLTATSNCQTQSSCAGTADEVKGTVSYGANLLPVGTSSGAGDGSLTATSIAAYDNIGNVVTVDGPLPGSADTVRVRYDADRRAIGTVSPDPDGAGPLMPRAVRTTYNADGQATSQESGTVTDQSDAAWGAFQVLEAVGVTYDANARAVKQVLSGGGTTYAASETSYDGKGRPECTAQRMNSAGFGALTNACSLGTAGSFGPDRITKIVYDAADQVTATQVAVGTADAATESASTYTLNGKLASLTDGENNRTGYEYDGLDRLKRTYYPVPTKRAGQSNGSDYEELGYDVRSLVTSRRVRDGQVIGFAFDALGRVTSKDAPGAEPDIAYAYDNLGRPTSATQPGQALGFTYDALGRTLTQAGPGGTLSSTFDIAGRRTRLTHPDGIFFTYDYLTTGETSVVRENGGLALATFAYDDLGRRTSLTRGNATVTSYAYDPVSRLQTLGHDLAGTANDLTLGFAYNPASQIATNTRSNDAYSFTPQAGSTGSAANGLNQLTQLGSATLSYDARGNLVSDGTKSYAYTSENRLTAASGVTLAYDPLGRLSSTSAGAAFDYDGADLVREAAGGQLLRRYVHGPGVDEPLVWYEGSGTSDRRYLHADERGSVVAVSDGAGNVIGINRYDEYGLPASANIGRFQYTGQKWLPEVALYDYKARMYDPRLQRFLQSDPIGWLGGPNGYGYTGGDPVNSTDPNGLCTSGSGRSTINTCIKAYYPSPSPARYPDITVTGSRPPRIDFGSLLSVISQPSRIMTSLFAEGLAGTGFASAERPQRPQRKPSFKIVKTVPKNALTCTGFGGIQFYAPPSFNLPKIVAAGGSGGLNPFSTNAAVGHYGTFDFQRTRDSAGNTTFYSAYSNASNYAAGAYSYGTGTPYAVATAELSIFSNLMSSNAGSFAQSEYFSEGFQDAEFNNVSCKKQ